MDHESHRQPQPTGRDPYAGSCGSGEPRGFRLSRSGGATDDFTRGHFVADGRDRALGTPEAAASQEEIGEAVRREFAEELAGAGFFRRLVIRARMLREFNRRLEAIAPEGACYLRQGATRSPDARPNTWKAAAANTPSARS